MTRKTLCTCFLSALIMLAFAGRTNAETITVRWEANPASDNVLGYVVYVGTSPGVYTQSFTITSGTTFTFSAAASSNLYYFAVSAFNAAGEGSKSTVVPSFTDQPLTAGVTIKAEHITELRTGINAVRSLSGLPQVSWTDGTIVPGQTAMKAAHLLEMRSALAAVYTARGRSAPSFTDSSINAGAVFIKASHITELRSALLGLQ